MKNKVKKKAEMGIGTLIIFIAMILVAAIAAGVLIQTASSLQNKALLTGERSQQQVSTSLKPMLLYAEDGSTGNNVKTFYMKMKLAPGSNPVKFDEMLVEVSLNNASYDYNFNGTADCENNVPVFNETVHEGFAIDYLIKGSSFSDGYLQRGDISKLCFQTKRNVTEDENFAIRLIPKIGNQAPIETAMPDILSEKRVTIYP
ncbi:MAG: archaellin/type IV pilin N-terminal domain-containing protein [Nanobdellota archaeon]